MDDDDPDAKMSADLEDEIDDDEDDDISVVEPSGGTANWTQSTRTSKASQLSTARQATQPKRQSRKNVDALWGGS
jgi:hypothetical protein